ncbi:hypothetical protein LF1_11840 [Rubripirellula obstinata]|uniref:DUF5666 domain-containing protein n=1 Tax=Rubripirellula obstinata TaxID=406547 RepID=A0A5B1CEL6_9BACT|nr:hypothetical protein [Rubripirellula obstinata]KAA1258662.1 hypothetical protein LF1_11840 [Rubripirellula obstinata]
MLKQITVTAALAFAMLFAYCPTTASAQQSDSKSKQSQSQNDSRKKNSKNQNRNQDQQSDSNERANGSKQSSESLTGEGQVRASKKVKIPGTTIENLVVLIDMKKPNSDRTVTRVVDLGPVKNLKSLKVRQGDQIKTTGRVVQVKDKQVMMADEVTSHNQTKKIKRQKPKSKSERDNKRDN